jgi:hypothetical protein
VDIRSSSVHLPHAGFQEPQELLQSWEKKACGQSELWCLLAGVDYMSYGCCCRHRDLSLWAAEPWGMLVGVGYQEPQHLVHAQRKQAFGKREPWILLAVCVVSWRAVQQHCKQGGTKHLGSVSLGNCFLAWFITNLSSCCRYGQSKPVGSRNLRSELPGAIVQVSQQVM